MIKFLKDSVRELRHVVWPTEKETRNFFAIVLALLVFFTLYLFAFSNAFSNIVFALKSVIPGRSSYSQELPIQSISDIEDMDINQLLSNEVQLGESET